MKLLPLVLILSTFSFSCSERRNADFEDVRLPVADNAMTSCFQGRPNAVLTINQDNALRIESWLDPDREVQVPILFDPDHKSAVRALEAANVSGAVSQAQIFLDRRATSEALIRAFSILEAAEIPNYEFIVLAQDGSSVDSLNHHSLGFSMPTPAMKAVMKNWPF